MMKAFLFKRLLPALVLTKNYARLVGVILFLIGLFGFAFRSDNSFPDLYLGGALVLGFWGIISGLWDNVENRRTARRNIKMPPSPPVNPPTNPIQS